MLRRTLLASLLATPALAQGYPNGPIRLIVPSPPGGGTDTLSRLIAHRLTETLRWQIVVENRPGAGGNIGMDAAAKAAPDGHTIVMGESANLVINPYLYARLPFDPARDLAPITLVGTVPLVLITQAGGSLDTPAAIVAAAKARPLSYGSGGNGTVGHLAAEAWKRLAGADIQHVVYRGGALAVTAVATGEVALHLGSVPAVASMLESGRVRAVAVTAGERLAQWPAVPTLAESGFPGFTAEVLYGLLAPAGTPAPILDRLNAEIGHALDSPELRAAMARSGVAVRGGSAAAFSAFLEQERAKWSRAVRDSGATVD